MDLFKLFFGRYYPRKWHNWGKNFVFEPFDMKETSKLAQDDFIALLREGLQQPGLLKAVGAGHSFSDILETEGLLLYRSRNDWKSMKAAPVSKADRQYLNDGAEDCLVNIAAWAKIWEINKALKKMGYAFGNLGSAVLQTYGGVIVTSTHGTGKTLPPLCDDVRSILLLKADGKLCRIEPTNGITAKEKYSPVHKHIELIQDDETFYSVLVSMGCMGVIIEFISCARQRFLLKEERTLTTWEKVRETLLTNPETYFKHRHFDLILNPHKINGVNNCVVTIRNIVEDDTPTTSDVGRFGRWIVVHFQRLVLRFLKNMPALIPKFLNRSLNAIAHKKPYIDESTEVFDLDLVNKFISVSAEYIFPTEGNQYIKAIDEMLATVERNTEKRLYQNQPFGVRFIAPSKAYLSMMHGRESCSIETSVFSGTDGWRAMLHSYERVCLRHNGRPHWGQYHELTGRTGWLQESYAKAETWLAVLKRLDPTGVFSNQFTRRMGFTYEDDSKS